MSADSVAVVEFVNVELTAILDETSPGWPLGDADRKRLDKLNDELKDAIKEGRYPIAELFEIRKIYTRKDRENG